MRLHPRNYRFLVAAHKTREVGHVAGNATFAVSALAHGIWIEVDHVKHLRKEFLPRAVVVVTVRPRVTASGVPEGQEDRRRRVGLLDGRLQVFSAGFVEEIEELRAGIGAIHLRRTPRAGRLHPGRRRSAERRDGGIGEIPQRKARGIAVEPACRIEDLVAEPQSGDDVRRKLPAVRAGPHAKGFTHVVTHALPRDRRKHGIASPLRPPLRILVVHAPVDGYTHLVEHARRAVRQVERQLHKASFPDFTRVCDIRRRIVLGNDAGRSSLHFHRDDAKMLASVEELFGDDDLSLAGRDVSSEVVSVAEHVVVRMLCVCLTLRIDRRLDDYLVPPRRKRKEVSVYRQTLVASAGHNRKLVSSRLLRLPIRLARVAYADLEFHAVLTAYGKMFGASPLVSGMALHHFDTMRETVLDGLLEDSRRLHAGRTCPHAGNIPARDRKRGQRHCRKGTVL